MALGNFIDRMRKDSPKSLAEQEAHVFTTSGMWHIPLITEPPKMVDEEKTFSIEEIEAYIRNVDHTCNEYNMGTSDTIINTLVKFSTFLLADNKVTELYVKRVERLNDALIGKYSDSI